MWMEDDSKYSMCKMKDHMVRWCNTSALDA